MRRPITLILVPLAAFALTACGASADDGKEGTSMSINVESDEGQPVRASADGKTGTVAINAPGFKAEMAMPKVALGADDFEMNGVKLYPGSKVIALKVDAVMRVAGAKDSGGGTVRVIFTSPATPEVVKAWFLERLTKDAKYRLTADANGMSGTTEDGEPFALTLRPVGDGQSNGTIVMTGGK
jgi:hypothetical protein